MSGRFNLGDYVTVDERIDRYWDLHPKPEGSIQTEIIWVANDGNSVAIRATVYQDDRILATGIAQEERLEGVDQYGKPLKGVNATSWWENAETSAIGRAIANMGMSLSKQRPSRQEMEKVERYESAPARDAAPGAASPKVAPTPIRAPEPEPPIEAEGDPPIVLRDDATLLDAIRNDFETPVSRWDALWDYYSKARDLAELNGRAEQVKASGMPTRDLKAAWNQHHARLAEALKLPASRAG